MDLSQATKAIVGTNRRIASVAKSDGKGKSFGWVVNEEFELEFQVVVHEKENCVSKLFKTPVEAIDFYNSI